MAIDRSSRKVSGLCAAAMGILGIALLARYAPAPVGSLPSPATAAAVSAEPPADCYHQHDGGPLHKHDHHQVPDVIIPPAARGRAHEVSLGGGAVKSFFILDEIVLGLAGADLQGREFQKLLAANDLSLVRIEPALDTAVVKHTGAGRLEAVIARLQGAPEIAWAEPNYIATVSQCCHSPFFTNEDPLVGLNERIFATMGVPEAHKLTRGKPEIIIAVLDSGVDAKHEDLAGAILPGKDFVNGDDDAMDDAGHGTGIAGLIAARDDNGAIGINGIAPGCKILPVKVADRTGKAAFADLASGIVWAVDRGARVINISLGSRTGSQLLEKAIRYAVDHKAVVIAAAGNDNTNVVHYPAAYDDVIAVGALAADGTISSVTNLSPRLDVAAPGEKLISTIPTGFYRPVSGTSTAAALASGAAALLLSLDPDLTPLQVKQALRASADPIDCLAPVADLFGVGRLDVARLVARTDAGLRDLAIAALRVVPEQPRPGQTVRVEVDVRNAGAVATAAVAPQLAGADGIAIRGNPFDAPPLAPGACRMFAYEFTPRAAGALELVARVDDGGVSEETRRNDVAKRTVTVVDAERPALRMTEIGMSEPSARAENVRFHYTLRNTGNIALHAVTLGASLDGTRLADGARTVDLEVGESTNVEFAWAVPSPAPSGTRFFRAEYACASANGGKPVVRPWTFILGNNHDGKELDPLYQQSGDVDIIADAPHRVNAGRPYVPLLVFVPSRGTAAAGPVLSIDHFTVTAKASPDPAAAGVVVLDDTASLGAPLEPTSFLPGLVQVDEDGKLVKRTDGSTDLNLFADAPLTMNGRHAIFRIPRSVLGVPSTPTTPVKKYFQVDVHWKFYTLASEPLPVKEGTQKWTLMVEFGTSALPTLPGDNLYFDTHHHTIAEWYQAVEVEPFAPMQAYGGPIQMVKESAYAIGLIDDPADIHDRVMTTDHNAFYSNPLEKDPNSPMHRPPFGPTSVANSTGPDGTIKDEFHRMRELFGVCAGEEISFSQDIYFGGYPIPIGAHMLGYRAAQQPGTWHGGSMVSLALGEGSPLYLADILKTMAHKASADNIGAFTYAAHPYSAQGWFGDNLDMSIGINPIYRNYDYVSDFTPNFIFRGLQLYNGYDSGAVPGAAIDFHDLNPWMHPEWAGGPGWDRELQVGLRNWHEMMSKVMIWSFYDKLGKKFIRKLYITGGSDAHGNFNFSSSRLATLIPLPSTFGLSKSSFGSCRSYVFTAGKPGATTGEKAMQALADGNHVATDGPIVKFAMDAEGRYDSAKQVWHDKASVNENADGRMGGGGAFGGEGTMLVKRGNPETFFGYRYANTPDYGSDAGAVKSILVYRDSDGSANPEVDRPYGSTFEKVVKGAGSLSAGGADKDLSEKVADAEEGTVKKVTAYSLGVFTGGNPDVTPIASAEHRCYSNPVWAIPYDVEVTVKSVNKVDKRIDAGELEVKFTFDLSMSPLAYKIGVKKLSAAGTTSDAASAPITKCSPLGVWGTNFATGADFARLVVTNDAAIPLSGDEYPSAGKYTFMVYFMDPLKDVNGNTLHSIATTFAVDKPADAKKCFVGAAAGAAGASWPAALLVCALAANLLRRRS